MRIITIYIQGYSLHLRVNPRRFELVTRAQKKTGSQMWCQSNTTLLYVRASLIMGFVHITAPMVVKADQTPSGRTHHPFPFVPLKAGRKTGFLLFDDVDEYHDPQRTNRC